MTAARPDAPSAASASRPPARAGAALLRLGLPLLLIALVWLAHYAHFHVDRSPVAEAVVEQARQAPDDARLDEIGHMSLAIDLGVPSDRVVATADLIVRGTALFPAYLDGPTPLTGYPADFRFGPGTFQLAAAGFGFEDILLEAYERTADARYLRTAYQRIQDFAAFELTQREAVDFLWNDHAIACRVAVVARLWRHIRHDPAYPADGLRNLLSLIARGGRFLAAPDHFTARTNHGVIQNVALMQIAAAFPSLPDSAGWARLGMERLALQLPFYVSPEGVVLEHSADYQHVGVSLLAMAVRLARLNDLPVSRELLDKSAASRTVQSQLQRPDGSLPAVGDSIVGRPHTAVTGATDGSTPVAEQPAPFPLPEPAAHVYPVSGYALWWTGDDPALRSQTVIAWAKHDGHGHKHADEGSLLLWSGGRDWLTSIAYWPYGGANEKAAYGWSGANAPHGIGELAASVRTVELLGSADDAQMHVVDLLRRTGDGAQFRRQIVQIDAQTWLVLDFVDGSASGSETDWTLPPALGLTARADDRSFQSTEAEGRRLILSLAAPSTTRSRILRGSQDPFAGWVSVNLRPTPASTLRVTDPSARSVTALLLALRPADRIGPQLSVAPGATPEAWSIHIDEEGSRHAVTRQGARLAMDDASVLSLAAPADIAPAQAVLRAAYRKAVDAFPPWRDLSRFRARIAYGLLALMVAQEIAWQVFIRRPATTPGQRRGVLLGLSAGWIALGAWIFGIYLA
ncbi:heparinase II/III family protein [Zoogloea sp.]|uniref:heparinase II/III family protein n=1 Tax=Zoogloea sp. TaxID=49181 RepID=UPI002BAA5C0C|nr:heparinase II/III family protein [Zoogloea sp.]HNH15037.1 heparinase II/III family protein [Zoogloea sp.]